MKAAENYNGIKIFALLNYFIQVFCINLKTQKSNTVVYQSYSAIYHFWIIWIHRKLTTIIKRKEKSDHPVKRMPSTWRPWKKNWKTKRIGKRKRKYGKREEEKIQENESRAQKADSIETEYWKEKCIKVKKRAKGRESLICDAFTRWTCLWPDYYLLLL